MFSQHKAIVFGSFFHPKCTQKEVHNLTCHFGTNKSEKSRKWPQNDPPRAPQIHQKRPKTADWETLGPFFRDWFWTAFWGPIFRDFGDSVTKNEGRMVQNLRKMEQNFNKSRRFQKQNQKSDFVTKCTQKSRGGPSGFMFSVRFRVQKWPPESSKSR